MNATHVRGFAQLPIDAIEPHPLNPRGDLGDLTELAASIKEFGIRQALTVVPVVGSDNDVTYRAVIGHRRLAAARLAGLAVVPALVDDTLSQAQQLELMLIENVQRADLTPFEEGRGYQGLLDLGVKIAWIAKRTGRARSTVDRRLALGSLDARIEESVKAHQLTLDDAILVGDLQDELPSSYTDVVARLDKGELPAWVLDVARSDLRRTRARKALLAQAADEGITVTDKQPSVWGGIPTLSQLGIKPAAHADCAGHAYAIDGSNTHKLKLVCTDAEKRHPAEYKKAHDKAIGGSPSQTLTPEQKAQREALETLSGALQEAKVARRTWLAAVMRGDDSPARARLTDRAIAVAIDEMTRRMPLDVELPQGANLTVLKELLHNDDVPSDRYSVQNCTVPQPAGYYRNDQKDSIAYLEFLIELGYPLTDAETTLLEQMRTALATAEEPKGKKAKK